MKKVLLCIAAVLLCVAAGCASPSAPQNTPSPQSGGMGVVNPVEEIAREQYVQDTGVDPLLPEDRFGEPVFTRINVSPAPIYAMEFEDVQSGDRFTFRLCMEADETDISDMYYVWISAEVAPEYMAFWNEEGQGICLWQNDKGVAFSLAMEQNATRDALVGMRVLLMQIQ